jgi:hypothetical protein
MVVLEVVADSIETSAQSQGSGRRRCSGLGYFIPLAHRE